MVGRGASSEEEIGPTPVFRCDRLSHAMKSGKEAAVLALLVPWRETAGTAASMAWRLFQRTGWFDPRHDVAKDHRKSYAKARTRLLDVVLSRPDIRERRLEEAERLEAERLEFEVAAASEVVKGDDAPEEKKKPRRRKLPTPDGLVDPMAPHKAELGGRPVQMVVAQVAGVLDSFLSNRMNDFVDAVVGSSLHVPDSPPGSVPHMLFAINRAHAWFDLDRVVRIQSKGKGSYDTVVPRHLRLLARKIMSAILKQHHKPSMKRIGMVVDSRVATLQGSTTSKTFKLWLRLKMPGRDAIQIPLMSHDRFEKREGKRCQSWQIGPDRNGTLSVGVVTDIGQTCEAERKRYASTVERDHLPLDWGVRNLIATDDGHLFGRNFVDRLKSFDATILGISRHANRSGTKLRDSKRYMKFVRKLRDFIATEVNRVFNRIVDILRPGHFVVEKLDFSGAGFSRRMNRILNNAGRTAVKAKLAALEQEKGITSEQVQAAYTSQTCPAPGCGYVDAHNRRGEKFRCLWCGHTRHADVVGSRNIGARRSRAGQADSGQTAPDRAAAMPGNLKKADTLALLVKRHREWNIGRVGPSADPRLVNPHFGGTRPAAARSSAKRTSAA